MLSLAAVVKNGAWIKNGSEVYFSVGKKAKSGESFIASNFIALLVLEILDAILIGKVFFPTL